MPEDIDNNEDETEDEGQTLWEKLKLSEKLDIEESDEEGDKYEQEEEQQDERTAKEDKLEKKLSAKVDNLQKKFESTMLRERISKFEESADEIDKDLFRTVAADIKTLEDFDKAMSVVRKRSDELRKSVEEYKKKLEEEAEKSTFKAWGTGPIGTPQKREESEEDILKRIYEGDSHAAFEAIVGDDFPPEV